MPTVIRADALDDLPLIPIASMFPVSVALLKVGLDSGANFDVSGISLTVAIAELFFDKL